MDVLIVGRTKMAGVGRCIGGLAADGSSLRLLQPSGGNWDVSAPFKIGQLWEVTYMAATKLIAPHVEDVIVSSFNYVNAVSYPSPELVHILTKGTVPWRGGLDHIFGGLLGFTGNNNGYVCQRRGVPQQSTWFWISDKDLTLRDDGRHYDYPYSAFQSRGLSYVGEREPVATLAAGTLLRVSLARWWRPEDADELEERCYLQLSGWF
jgi:hypothetical protein